METPLKLAIFIIFTSLSSLSAVKESPLSATNFVASVLTHLGFHELAMAVPSLLVTSSTAIWSGPLTVFAPSDASIHTCSSCSVPRILQEHIVPGIFSLHYLQSLAFGTKIETIVPGRCVRVTSTGNGTKIFVGKAEVTRPEIFNNGLFVVHGIDGYIAHLSPFSCNIERITSLSFSRKYTASAAKTVGGGVWIAGVMSLLVIAGVMMVVGRGRSSEALECEACPDINPFKSETALTRHFRTIHKEFKIKCAVCKHKFLTHDSLTQHRIEKHSYVVPNPIQFRCLLHKDPCIFESRASIRAHNKSIHPKEGVECYNEFCLNVFATKKQMLVHRAHCDV